LQFDLPDKMDYYISRFFEIRSGDLLAQSIGGPAVVKKVRSYKYLANY